MIIYGLYVRGKSRCSRDFERLVGLFMLREDAEKAMKSWLEGGSIAYAHISELTLN